MLSYKLVHFLDPCASDVTVLGCREPRYDAMMARGAFGILIYFIETCTATIWIIWQYSTEVVSPLGIQSYSHALRQSYSRGPAVMLSYRLIHFLVSLCL